MMTMMRTEFGYFQSERLYIQSNFPSLLDVCIWGCIQNFPDWPPGARTANGTALCRYVNLYRYFVSHSSEFCRHNSLYCFSTIVYCCRFIHSARKFLDTPSYLTCSDLWTQLCKDEQWRQIRIESCDSLADVNTVLLKRELYVKPA
jgi:hypothetical protein